MTTTAQHRARALWLRQLALVLVALLIGVLASGPSEAATHPLRIESRCQITTAPDLPVDAALAALARCDKPSPGGASGSVWLDYSDLPMLAHPQWVWRLMFDNHRVEAVDVYVIRADRTLEHIVYDPTSPNREWATGDYFSIRLLPRAAPVERILVKLTGSAGSSLVRAPKLMPAPELARYDRNSAAGYGVIVGMLAITILFHFTLFFAIQRRFQLYYCAHVALLLLYALCYSNLILIVAPQLSATMLSRLVGFATSAATATGTLFLIDFLGARLLPSALRRWAQGGAVLSIIAASLLLVGPSGLSKPIYLFVNVVGTHAVLLVAVILLTACWRRSRTAMIMLAGWSMPIFVAILFPLRNFGIISDSRIPDGAMLLAVTIECLVLSLPIAYRIKGLRIDHERARERHQVLERQALTDVLTGLANRRGFLDAIDRAYGRLAKPVLTSLLVIDIDHFKRINDRYGHGCGDAILSSVANHVARVAGAGAIVARYGGEEFVVALRDYDLIRAGALAEQLRGCVGASVGDAFGGSLPSVTISIGVASGMSDQIERLITDADAALYRAKNEGRNRVALSTGQRKLTYAAAA